MCTLERNATVLVALFLTNGNAISYKFEGEVCTFSRRELAAWIYVLAIFEVFNHAIIAIFGRNGTNVSSK